MKKALLAKKDDVVNWMADFYAEAFSMKNLVTKFTKDLYNNYGCAWEDSKGTERINDD